jgi:hypothetical protein
MPRNTHPFSPAKRDNGLCNRVIEGFRGHVDGVCSLIQIVDGDDTRFAAHACNLSYSPFIRPRGEANVCNYASGGTRVHLPFLRYT